MIHPEWTVRPAQAADAAILTDIVVAATRDQGRWPLGQEESTWRKKFLAWTRTTATGPSNSALFVIEVDGVPIGRLRVIRELMTPPYRIELAGLQLLPT